MGSRVTYTAPRTIGVNLSYRFEQEPNTVSY